MSAFVFWLLFVVVAAALLIFAGLLFWMVLPYILEMVAALAMVCLFLIRFVLPRPHKKRSP